MIDAIKEFIEAQTCANLCSTDDNGQPYCFSCFYAFDSINSVLYFKSSKEAHHSDLLTRHFQIAGTILPNKFTPLHIQGVQLKGILLNAEEEGSQKAAAIYYKAHPMALAMPGDLWTVRVDWIKLTDNKLGFGKKLVWSR